MTALWSQNNKKCLNIGNSSTCTLSSYRCYMNWKNTLSKHSFLQIFSQRQHSGICSPVSLSNCWLDMKVGFMNTDYAFNMWEFWTARCTSIQIQLLFFWTAIDRCFFFVKRLRAPVPSGSSSLSIASWSLATVNAWSSLSTGLSLTTSSQLNAFGLKTQWWQHSRHIFKFLRLQSSSFRIHIYLHMCTHTSKRVLPEMSSIYLIVFFPPRTQLLFCIHLCKNCLPYITTI